MSDHASADTDRILDALGEPARRRILELLAAGPTPVGQLAEQLAAGRPGVSKHLRVLSDAGLVQRRSVGTRNLYALVPGGLAPLQKWLTDTWDIALAAYADHVAAVTEVAKPQRSQRVRHSRGRNAS
jgi:DNA-binding transcriptional ArsR family regulator